MPLPDVLDYNAASFVNQTGYDMRSIRFCNQFVKAQRERANEFVGGTDPLSLRIANSLTTTEQFGYSGWINALQAWVETRIGGYYVDLTPTITPTSWTWGNYMTAHMGGVTWTAKFHRKFADAAATVYLNKDGFGSFVAFANGHYATNMADRRTYHRVAGAWVLVTDGTPPDQVTVNRRAVRYDDIGSWLFTELRTAFNVMATFGITYTSVQTRQREVDHILNFATRAAAEADGETAWAASSPVVVSPVPGRSYGQLFIRTGALGDIDGWGYRLHAEETTFRVTVSPNDRGFLDTIQNRHVTMWGMLEKPGPGFIADVEEFDYYLGASGGEGVISAIGPFDGTTEYTPLAAHPWPNEVQIKFGDVNTRPPWPLADPTPMASTTTSVARGFKITVDVAPAFIEADYDFHAPAGAPGAPGWGGDEGWEWWE